MQILLLRCELPVGDLVNVDMLMLDVNLTFICVNVVVVLEHIFQKNRSSLWRSKERMCDKEMALEGEKGNMNIKYGFWWHVQERRCRWGVLIYSSDDIHKGIRIIMSYIYVLTYVLHKSFVWKKVIWYDMVLLWWLIAVDEKKLDINVTVTILLFFFFSFLLRMFFFTDVVCALWTFGMWHHSGTVESRVPTKTRQRRTQPCTNCCCSRFCQVCFRVGKNPDEFQSHSGFSTEFW